MLFFVPTPIGNLYDISIHVLEILNKCNIIICEDTRVTKKLLMLLNKDILIHSNFKNINIHNKKFYSFHSHNQNEFISNLTLDFFQENIAFCTDAGMPNISDPGALLLQYARNNNIQYEVLLGGCAFSHAFVCSGLEGGFCFLGFLPHKQHNRQIFIKNILEYHKSLHIVLYESPKRLKNSLHDILLIMPNANIYVYKELTKLHQTEYIGKADIVLNKLPDEIRGEYCIVIEKENMDSMCNTKSNKVLHLTQDDILKLDISPKQKAKLLSQLSTKSIKEWYLYLINEKYT